MVKNLIILWILFHIKSKLKKHWFVFGGGIFLFDLTNMISNYTKDFSWKNGPKLPYANRKKHELLDYYSRFL